MQRLLRSIVPERIAIELETPPSLPPVLVDAQQLDQVVMNLCVNARDAMPEGGRIVVRASEETLTPELVRATPGATPGRHVCLSIIDTGHGLAPQVMERMLEPFFTTKEPGDGTGLGLAVVAGIVEQHGGVIVCTSEPGAGTEIKVCLPVYEGSASPAAAEASRTAALAGTEWILLADDEPAVRDVAVRILERAGYHVVAVEDGALAVVEASRRHFDLVVLDGVMPGMTGREAWERIREARPQTRFLLMSGYASAVFSPELLARSGLVLLAKPFGPDDLLRAVRGVLDGT
jgi:CheY-like chemotaxis protein